MNIPLMRFVFKKGWIIQEVPGGYGIFKYSEKEHRWKEVKVPPDKKSQSKKRSKSAQQFIEEVQKAILETGVVKNTHSPYDPRHNKRYKVDPHRARVIAWRIAKSKGLRAGRKPPHLHKN